MEFFAEYGAYYYAYRYGIRPPLEGIPYVQLAVTLLTFTLLMGEALAFAAVYALALALLFVMHNYFAQADQALTLARRVLPKTLLDSPTCDDLLDAFRAMPPVRAGTFAALASLLVGTMIAIIAVLARESVLVAVPGSVAVGTTVLLVWRRSTAIWLGLIGVLTFVATGIALIFNTHLYGVALRGLGYGGGIPITIVFASPEGEARPNAQNPSAHSAIQSINGALMLRTNDAVIVFDREAHAYLKSHSRGYSASTKLSAQSTETRSNTS